jgi:biotin transport system substrate-specific component
LGGALCGKRVGFFAPLIYLILGLIGLPIFSAGGGITYFLYPTFGYLLGFTFAGMIAGICKQGLARRIVCNLVAVLVIHVIGVIYFYFMSNFYMQVADALYTQVANIPVYTGASVSLWQAVLTGSLIFLPIDIASAIVSAIVANKISPIINK